MIRINIITLYLISFIVSSMSFQRMNEDGDTDQEMSNTDEYPTTPVFHNPPHISNTAVPSNVSISQPQRMSYDAN